MSIAGTESEAASAKCCRPDTLSLSILSKHAVEYKSAGETEFSWLLPVPNGSKVSRMLSRTYREKRACNTQCSQ